MAATYKAIASRSHGSGSRAALWMLLAIVCLGAAPRPSFAAPLPGRSEEARGLRAVPGEYVVIFGDGVSGLPLEGEPRSDFDRRRQALTDSAAAETAVIRAGGRILYRYRDAVIGFAGVIPPSAFDVVRAATADRAYVQPNWEARQWSDEDRPMMAMKLAAATPPLSQGLDRIGQRLLSLNQTFQRPATGSLEVHAYVIDSGIRASHSEFARPSGPGSRVGPGYDAYSPASSASCFRHGTHVAGTIGGRTVGVAPSVLLHSVRVIDCYGNVTSAVAVAGVNWVLGQYWSNNPSNRKSTVANMSLEFGLRLPGLDWAIQNSIAAGITYVVAAGNHHQDACLISPAGVQHAITVGSVDPEDDTRAGSSGVGLCVDLFAPGIAIISASSTNDIGWDYQDGTSSAAPHAAGVAALILSRTRLSPAAVWTAMANAANVTGTPGWCGVVDRGPNSPNRLLHWGAGSLDGTADSETLLGAPQACSH